MLAVMLIGSPAFKCSEEILTIVAMLSVPNVFVRPALARKRADEAKLAFAQPDGDHLTLINVYEAFISPEAAEIGVHKWCRDNFLSYRSLTSAKNVRRQLERIMQKHDLELISEYNQISENQYWENIKKALVAGFFMQVAKKKLGSKSYLTVKDNQDVLIHPSTVLAKEGEWMIYNEFVLTSKNYIRTVTVVKPDWLVELAPKYYNLDHFAKGDVRLSLERVIDRVDTMNKLEGKKLKKSKK